ncbi:MAG: hypothetical protein AAB923_00855 [Patescibacteria group bacterium]
MKKEYAIGLGVVVVAVLFIGIFVLRERQAPATGNEVSTTTPSTTITGGGYTIEAVPLEDFRDFMPSLTRKVQFGASIPTEVRPQIGKRVADVLAKLTADPTQVADWLELGLLYHTANDYQGAKEVWEFLIKVVPNDTVSYDNLGKLYHFNLKDYPKAEEYFLKSIAIASTSTLPYYELHTLYRYSYKKDTAAAADILKKLANIMPADPNPWFQLGLYYRDIGKATDAKAALTTAMDKARAAGMIELMTQIGAELQRFAQ